MYKKLYIVFCKLLTNKIFICSPVFLKLSCSTPLIILLIHFHSLFSLSVCYCKACCNTQCKWRRDVQMHRWKK